MLTDKTAFTGAGVTLPTRLLQLLRNFLVFIFPKEMDCSLESRAVQAAEKVLNNWSQGLFVSLPPEFSQQMIRYWTPGLQERVYRSLETDSGALVSFKAWKYDFLRGPGSYIFLNCQADWSNSSTRSDLQLVIRWDGVISAFYVTRQGPSSSRRPGEPVPLQGIGTSTQ